MTDRMEHITLDGYGEAEVMRLVTGPRPVAGPGEVLIEVAFAGVNRPDIVQRQGSYPPPPGVTEVLGLEVSGRIAAVGPDVARFHAGEEVCALVAGGGYAGYVVAPEPQVLPLPKGFDLATAAAIPETFFTVWTNLYDSGKLAPGETVLIHAGSSGIGTTAIQLASALDARVFTTVSADDRIAPCLELGADIAVNYRTEDYVARLTEATGGAGVDVILDMRAGEFFPKNMQLLATGGRMVHIASLAGREVTLDIGLMMRKRAIITGTTLRARPVAEKGRIAAALEAVVWPLFEAGRIRPRVDRIYRLEDAVSAHRALESGEIVGKAVLAVR
ncbi:NAD(P)H-quinone oxidoreductase [Haematobacter sp. UBA3484]|uniref:NAD(P)H-quinone oxidoreductase n=2 Tax=unclassified Haematobacter TaxID=2640585 RepID=UPI0025C158D7|nr:NAD(P)H-quinone oxidoreductase [Haematobacter sp. UBA3484]